MKTGWSRNAEAIVWVTIATALFSIIFASGKFAGELAPPLQVNVMRYMGGAVTLIMLASFQRQKLSSYRSGRPLFHFIRTVFGVSGGLTIIQSSTDMPIVDATAISLLYVVFVVLLGVMILGERLGWRHVAGILACFAGAALVVTSRGAFRHVDIAYIAPALLALFGALLLAVEGIMIKLLAQSDRPMVVMLHVNIFGLLLLAVPAWFVWQPVTVWQALPYVLLGPMGIAAQYCVIRGYRMADLSVVGPVDYSWLIFASLIGLLFFNEIPTVGVAIGCAFIVLGGIVLATIKPRPEKQSLFELQ